MYKNASFPLLVIFGLDYTLWPFWIGTERSLVKPPFFKISPGKVVDSTGKTLIYYKEVPRIFEEMKNNGVRIGITSATTNCNATEELINLFEWREYVSFAVIDERHKVKQIREMKRKSGIPFLKMLFFDDLYSNVYKVGKLGVCSVLVGLEGMTLKTLKEGFKQYRRWIEKYAEQLTNRRTVNKSVSSRH